MTSASTYGTAKSAELSGRARESIPGGVNSNVRLLGPGIFFERASGSRLIDVDGNEYIDYLLGQGPNFLGHAPEDILDAVDDACRRGMVYGAQHPLEVEAAELVLACLGWGERIRFGVSGTESLQAALRVARAATGRTKFVRFAGHYHGWLDNVLVKVEDGRPVPASAGQMASHLDDSIMLEWNDLAAVEKLLADRGDEIAAVVMEPIMFNTGSIEPADGYLDGVRTACDRHDVVLILDEVISGFRVARGGAAERYGVEPDLATYGKAMAGGWPASALVGRADLMDRFGTGEVNHSGTFNASVMACAAVEATMRRLIDDPPYEHVTSLGTRLMAGIRELADQHGLELNVQGVPMGFHVGFGPGPVTSYRDLTSFDNQRYSELCDLLIAHGVWVAGRGIWYVSAAHDETDVAETLDRVAMAMKELA